ncbi:MAG: SIS domain-containing protein [Desulfovibrio sp.]|jgi:D-sedoheptulose 7-phosphate isomerase|nr:SIS domain-containing protein [Desulfovibrio sp.]
MNVLGASILLPEIDGYLATIQNELQNIGKIELLDFLDLLVMARLEGKQIFTMGNGGSAATASHFVCDFNKGLSYGNRKKYRAICLNDNFPTVMAYANDVSYDAVFIEQLKNFMRAGDLVIGISGSGNSMNVVNAIDWANQNGGETIALVGYDGGRLKNISRHCIHVKINDMQVVEDVHMVVVHMCMRILSKLSQERESPCRRPRITESQEVPWST